MEPYLIISPLSKSRVPGAHIASSWTGYNCGSNFKLSITHYI
ncbi:hypothetical protein CASFOL_016596 [Castilleja foliolosa]|uniref:Uncharacterized protein n=1 Tax=Castilleja foliolosa TaxID=1961234 RepID=A0ABD3DBS7_9LAMI